MLKIYEFFFGKISTEKYFVFMDELIMKNKLVIHIIVLSLRTIEVRLLIETLWSNELILKTNVRTNYSVNNINQRTFFISSTSNLEIYFRVKITKMYYIRSSLNIHRFLLEFIHINNNNNNNQ